MKKVLKVIGLVAIAELPGLGIACLSNKVPQTGLDTFVVFNCVVMILIFAAAAIRIIIEP